MLFVLIFRKRLCWSRFGVRGSIRRCLLLRRLVFIVVMEFMGVVVSEVQSMGAETIERRIRGLIRRF